MNRFVETTSIKKAIEILSKNILLTENKIRNSLHSKEIFKIWLLSENKNSIFERIVDDISFGKTNHIIDYKKQESFKYEGRDFYLIDYRESIIILSLLLELLDENYFKPFFSKEYESKNISLNYFSPTYGFEEEGNLSKSRNEFELMRDGIINSNEKGEIQADDHISIDIKRAFQSLNLNYFEERLINDGGDKRKIKYLITILKRIGNDDGIPLLFGTEIISRIIWWYSFENIIPFAEMGLLDNSIILIFVDEIQIFKTDLDGRKVIKSISRHLSNFGLAINNKKTILCKTSDILNADYQDDYLYKNNDEEAFENIDSLPENKKSSFISYLLDIEINYIKKRKERPWDTSPTKERINSLRDVFKNFGINYNHFISQIILRKYVFKKHAINFAKLDAYIDFYIGYVTECYDTMSEEEMLWYLCLIDKNKNPSLDIEGGIQTKIREKESAIMSSFQWRHEDFPLKNNIEWIYNVNRGNKKELANQIWSEIVSTYNYSIISVHNNWNEGSMWLLLNNSHFYSKDIFVKITSSNSIAAWFYSTYIVKFDIEKNYKAAENKYRTFLKGGVFHDIVIFRNDSPISHLPSKKNNHSVMQVLDNEYDLEGLFEMLKIECDKLVLEQLEKPHSL